LQGWPDDATVVAPVVQQLVRIEGDIEDETWTEHLVFRALTFSDTDWSLPGVQSFADWRARGLDKHTITADPLFVDLAHDDYTLQSDSPAFEAGFVPLDLSEVGLRGRD
jgi:hypothetical protein